MKNERPNNKQDLSPDSGITPGKKRKCNSRTKGNTCEIKYAKIFREELGFGKCKTSRQASRMLDDCKVDLANIPYNIQIKKGYWKSRPKPDEIFKEMRKLLSDNLMEDDPRHQYPRVLIHELDGYKDEHCLVTMMWKDWVKMLKIYNEIIHNIKI